MVLFIIILLLTPAHSRAESGEQSSGEADEVKPVQLAGVLVRDGHYRRAEQVLSEVDPEARQKRYSESFDRAMFHTLSGIVALKNQAFRTAVDQLETAIRYGQTDDRIFVHLAQAYYGLRDWEMVALSVRNADEAGRAIPDLYLMEARAHREMDDLYRAWQALAAGRERFPEHRQMARQQIFLLVKLELYQMALQMGAGYLSGGEAGRQDFVAVAEAFRGAGQYREAQVLLEEARLRWPESVEVLVHLAHAYIGAGRPGAAAPLMQIAAEYERTYITEAAELFRRAGMTRRALFMNARMVDQAAKFRQRVAILVEDRAYERVAAMGPRLRRLGLLEDDKILYALAYAHFEIRDWKVADRLLAEIEDPEVYQSAVELRRAIETCREDPTRC